LSTADASAVEVVQIKVWLLGISPMVWRRLLVPSTCTLHELHGVIQVAMGWEGIHLYQFCLRSCCYGSWELAASSPEVTLAALRLRKRARFAYEYDLNIPWRHEVRIEDHLLAEPGKAHPRCIGGNGACPPPPIFHALRARNLDRLRPRIVMGRLASWPDATPRCRWTAWRAWTPWPRSSARPFRNAGWTYWGRKAQRRENAR